MTATDFRRIALSLEGAEESSHMGAPDFRVEGRIFATLASGSEGYGNLMLTVEQQQAFIADRPDLFIPIKGGWGRMGMTHIVLAKADEDSDRRPHHRLEAPQREKQETPEKQEKRCPILTKSGWEKHEPHPPAILTASGRACPERSRRKESIG